MQQTEALITAEKKPNWYNYTVEVPVKGTGEEIKFSLYVGKAQSMSPVFAKQIVWNPDIAKYSWRGDHIRADPDIFKLLLQWMDGGKFQYKASLAPHFMRDSPALSHTNGEIDLYKPMIHLWWLAFRLQLPSLANQAADTMISLSKTEPPPSEATLRPIFEGHSPLPLLQKLMVYIWARSDKPPQHTRYIRGFTEGLTNECMDIINNKGKKDRSESRRGRMEVFHMPAIDKSEWPREVIDLTLGDAEERLGSQGTSSDAENQIRPHQQASSANSTFIAPTAIMQPTT